jgi:UDP-N-acetylglucosamine 1-carboxyvinyltransferase
MLALETVSKGTGIIVENLFETRFKIYAELTKMGADITIRDRMALIKGVEKLYGAKVTASDLRGGASLVLAGLTADGYTTIEDIYHIDRGYKNIENDLTLLGAEIERINI